MIPSADTSPAATQRGDLTPDMEQEAQRIARRQGITLHAARAQVLAKDHPLDCECEVCA